MSNYKIVLTGLIGVLIGVVVSSGSLGVDEISNGFSEVVSFDSASLKDVSLNGSKYEGEVVSVSGSVALTAPAKAPVDYEVSDSAGYSVGIKCGDYLQDYEPRRTYSFTGKVKIATYEEILGNKVVNYTYIDCSKPPK